MTYLNPRDWGVDVQLGKTEFTVVHRFGHNDNVGTAFVPIAVGGVYQTPTTVATLEIVSDNTVDTSGGSGAQKISVEGLTASWGVTVQEVTLNGTTPVTLTTDLIRAYRVQVIESGTYANSSIGSHVGNLTLQEVGGGDTWGVIEASEFAKGTSEIGSFTIPLGMTGYISNLDVSTDSSKSATVILFARENAGVVAAPYTGVMKTIKQMGGISGEESHSPKVPFGPFVGPCDIGFLGKFSTGSGEINVDFEILCKLT